MECKLAKLAVHAIAVLLRQVPLWTLSARSRFAHHQKEALNSQCLYMLANIFTLYCVSSVKTAWQLAQLYLCLNHTSVREMNSCTSRSKNKSKQELKGMKESVMLVVSNNKLCTFLEVIW